MPSVKDEAAFTAHVAERIKTEIPGAEVMVTGVRTIRVKINGRGLTASLDNLVADCHRDPSECERLVDDYVKVTQAASRADDAPVQKADIRVVVRNAEYVKELTAPTLHDPKRSPIVQQLVGDLWLVCVVDQPRNTISLSHERAAKIGLTKDQAIALGKSNVKGALPSLSSVTSELPANGIGLLDSGFYESSRWLLHGEWEPLSKQYNGHLIVALPAPDLILYGDGSSAEKRAALATLVKRVTEKASRQLSTKLFRWTKTGWEVVE
jgi:uncharacterized protein YtpQ (UPF0354 family)